jgi:hypothetical protein
MVVALLAAAMCGGDKGTTPSNSDPVGVLTAKAVACTSEASMKRLVELSDDSDAFARFILNPVNGCRAMDGEPVVVVDGSSWGLRRFHLKGDPQQLWTLKESIR